MLSHTNTCTGKKLKEVSLSYTGQSSAAGESTVVGYVPFMRIDL